MVASGRSRGPSPPTNGTHHLCAVVHWSGRGRAFLRLPSIRLPANSPWRGNRAEPTRRPAVGSLLPHHGIRESTGPARAGSRFPVRARHSTRPSPLMRGAMWALPTMLPLPPPSQGGRFLSRSGSWRPKSTVPACPTRSVWPLPLMWQALPRRPWRDAATTSSVTIKGLPRIPVASKLRMPLTMLPARASR